jgi:SAM-dependent methyltransferase
MALEPRPQTPVEAAAPCPITGAPSPLVQTVSVKLIKAMWRFAGADGLDELYGEHSHFGLYGSPCGLMFFHPAIAGDERFYDSLYARVDAHRLLGRKSMRRMEFVRAAAHVGDGEAVLDVGCGAALFRHHVPRARYQGVDPFAPPDASPCVARESLAEHADRNPEAYDVVCAFQVIEHVADPLAFTGDMLRALRPGGRIVLCAPLHPSPLTDIPNNLVNGPPHHLTWWNEGAFHALCAQTALEPLDVGALPPSPYQAGFFWLRNILPYRTADGIYFASRKSWNYALVAAYYLQPILAAVFGLPANAQPVDIFMAARKPPPAKQ